MRATIVCKKRVTIHRTIAFRRRGDGREDAETRKKKPPLPLCDSLDAAVIERRS
jgi:hypothetical protein